MWACSYLKQSLSWPNNAAIPFYSVAVHPSESTTVFIYRAARSWAQGEFSQFETVWPSSMICGCYTGHHFPSSPPALFRGLGLVCGGWRIFSRRWQQEWWATRPWRELMRHAWVMRLQSCSREKPERRITRYTLSQPLTSAEQSGDVPARTSPTYIHNNAGVEGDMAAVRSHLWGLGLPLLPVVSGSWQEKTSAKLSPHLLRGFHWKDKYSL